MEQIRKAADEGTPVHLIKRLVDDVHNAIGMQVSFSDVNNERLVWTEHGSAFCEKSRSIPALQQYCHDCAMRARECAKNTDGAYFYRCWRGLMNTCIAIRLNGQVIGTLLIAGYISTQEYMDRVEQISLENAPAESAYTITPEEWETIPFIDPQRVGDIVQIICIAASYISEAYRRQETERLQVQAEFKALQSQINPHFLFNALNSISQLALLEGATQTPEAIYSLAALLRRSMRQNSGLVWLEDELAFVHDYVRLKQMVGTCPIEYVEHIEPGSGQVMLPSLTIQPLVENAICHGLEPKMQGGTVTLTANTQDNHLIITVTDDGVGFDTAIVKENQKGEASGIGFSNVISRLNLFYSNDIRYEVKSSIGEGTTVMLSIPTGS